LKEAKIFCSFQAFCSGDSFSLSRKKRTGITTHKSESALTSYQGSQKLPKAKTFFFDLSECDLQGTSLLVECDNSMIAV